MIYHYSGCNQIPGVSDDYKFTLPKFGESTTDPTYYEPTATRIANMKKTAGSMQGLYDFADSAKSEEQALSDLSSSQVDVRFSKHGMTKEEISQVTMEKSLQADSLLKNKKSEKADNSKQLEKELAMAEAIASKMTESADNSADNSADSGD